MLRPKPNSRSDLFESLTGPTLHMSPGTAGAVTFIAEGAVALVAIGQVVASGPVVAGPGRALVDVQLTVWTLESWHTVAAEVIKPWALGHTESAVVAWLTGTAPELWGHAAVASILCSLALGPWSARV